MDTSLFVDGILLGDERSARIVRAFYESLALHGVPPSTRELMTACGISSSSMANYYVRDLVRSGVLVRLSPPSGRNHTARGVVPARWLELARGLAKAALDDPINNRRHPQKDKP